MVDGDGDGAEAGDNAARVQGLVQQLFLQGGRVLDGQAVNISQTGARLILEDATDDCELTVEFEGKLAMLARTVWRQPLANGRQIVGVAFEGFHWSQRVALDNYIYHLEQAAA